MVCPECNISVADGTDLCPQCGFAFKNPPSPETSYETTASSCKKRNIPAIVFGSLFALTLAFLIFYIYRYNLLFEENAENMDLLYNEKIHIHSLEQDISGKESEISDLEKLLEDANLELDFLSENKEYYDGLMEVLSSEKSWGYATENFHVDKGVMVIDRFGGMHELKLYSTYYTTFTFEISDTDVFLAEWSDSDWINKDTTVFITPVSSGYATLTFRNDLYESYFKVLVIVK